MDEDEPAVRKTDEVKEKSAEIARDLLRIIDLEGDLKPPGYVVGLCGDRDADKFYRINNFWSIAGATVTDLRKTMARLKEELPRAGWDIASYGPAHSKAQQLTLIANYRADKFSVSIEALEPSPKGRERSLLYVGLTSACYQAPEGEKTGY
ncbi:hypothetical protein ACMA1D_11235 [Streptomyces sp. 796.1]|uniref:hypothetical protein n=1 Tax=Streptomyces sp. 796.1 TaxID=3163029 RepID=UPI0039C9AD60